MRIRSKLAILIMAPLLALGLAAGLWVSAQNQALATATAATENHDDSRAVQQTMLAIGTERLLALGASVGDPAAVQTATDTAIDDLLARSRNNEMEVVAQDVRDLVDQARADDDNDIAHYSEANAALSSIDNDSRGYPDPSSHNAITINRFTVQALEAGELAWIDYLTADEMNGQTLTRLTAQFAKADQLLEVANRLALEEGETELSTLTTTVSFNTAAELQSRVIDGAAEGSPSVPRSEAIEATSDLRDDFAATIDGLNNRLSERLDDDVNETRSARLLLAVLAFMGLATAAAMVLIVSRSIIKPLDHLITRAKRVANVDLPNLVEVLGTDDLTVEVPEPTPIQSGNDDEIGEVAQAFNDLQSTAYNLATEQVTGRRNVAELFVNLARRNQQLLQRILEQLTELESGEEDPDKLAKLFLVDNVVTRMRRNAESLLALAGTHTSRRWARPIPVEHAVRAAFGEVEGYDRIDVEQLDPTQVSGGVVANVSHLLAELLENSLNFSSDSSRVVVEGRQDGEDYVITVTDSGIGMNATDLGDYNLRLDNPPPLDRLPTRFLGLYVVGRLAHRHGITVTLAAREPVGVVATVVLPGSVLVAEVDRPEPNETKFNKSKSNKSKSKSKSKSAKAKSKSSRSVGADESSPLEADHDLDAELAWITKSPETSKTKEPQLQDPSPDPVVPGDTETGGPGIGDAPGDAVVAAGNDGAEHDTPDAVPELIDGLPVRSKGKTLDQRAAEHPGTRTAQNDKSAGSSQPVKKAADSAEGFSSMMSSLSTGITRGQAESESESESEDDDEGNS